MRVAVLGALLVGCGGSPPADEPVAGSGGAVGGAAGAAQQGELGGNGAGGVQGGSGGASGDAGGGAGASAGTSAPQPDAGAVEPSGTPHVYVSGYGPNITHFTLDLASGALTDRGAVQAGTSPSYLAIAPSKRALYAVDESGSGGSRVIAFAIDAESGALTEIDSAPSGGEGAPHLAVHPSGSYVAVAHYGSGHTTILPVGADYGVSDPIESERGPSDGCGKAHQAVFDASGQHLLVPCLESGYVLQLVFGGGALSYATPATAAVSGGPRHLALAPDERHAYVLSELDSTITSFAYDAMTGTLSDPQTIDSQQESKGASAHIVVHPSGRFLYASNRGENSLGLFAIDGSGRLAAVSFERDGIDTPRDFTVDPTGTYLILANQNGSGDLRVYRIAAEDGRLTHVQTQALGGSPTFVGVILLP